MGDHRKTHRVSVVREFSNEPYGRTPDDGPDSAQRFRNDLLIPALRRYDKVVVDLRGAFCGSSFLEETFGGLIRAGFIHEHLQRKLVIEADIESYIHASWKYIAAEDENRNR